MTMSHQPARTALRRRTPRTSSKVATLLLTFSLGMTGCASPDGNTVSDATPPVVAEEPDAEAASASSAAAQAEAEASASAQKEREESERKAEEERERLEAEEERERKRIEAEEKEREEAEAAVEAALEEQRLDPSNYDDIDRRAWAKVVRDPDSYAGDMYVIYGYVTQFDSATGTDTFRANTDAVMLADWYDYDHNTLVGAPDEKLIADVLNGDVVKMHIEVIGSFSYDTQIGGNTSVPLVAVNIIEIVSSSVD